MQEKRDLEGRERKGRGRQKREMVEVKTGKRQETKEKRGRTEELESTEENMAIGKEKR